MSWTEYPLDELGSVSRGRSRHRPRDAAHLYGGLYPFIQTGDVKHAGLYLSEFTQTYSEAGLTQSKLWQEGTLCITIAANIADTSILKIEACFPDSIIGFIPYPEKSDARFIKYLFDARFKKEFQKFTQGAAQDNLSQGKLLSLKFPVPKIDDQHRIAAILSAYDDLIENNRRRILLLEEAARQLYKEWFVRLRFPGHEHTKITNGVPDGWVLRSLDNCIRVIKSAADPKALDADTPYIGLEHLPRRSITLSEWETAAKVESGKFHFKERDIIFGKIRPYFHKVGFALTDGIASSDSIVMRAIDDDLWPLVLMAVSSDRFVALAAQTVKEGSKMPRANWHVLKAHPLTIPPEGLLGLFGEQIRAITSQTKSLALAIAQAAKARDLLLPRLMNGSLTV